MYTATITRRTRNLGFVTTDAESVTGTPGIVAPQSAGRAVDYWTLGGRRIHWRGGFGALTALITGTVDSVEVQIEGDPPTKRATAGRPETGTTITVRIPDEVLAACDAQPEGRAGFIRLAVEQALAGRS